MPSQISPSAVGRALKGWPRKKLRRIAAQRRADDLGDYFLDRLAKLDVKPFRILYVDESSTGSLISLSRLLGQGAERKTRIKYNKVKARQTMANTPSPHERMVYSRTGYYKPGPK